MARHERQSKPRQRKRRSGNEPIVVYNSKVKMGILAAPCLFAAGLAIKGLITGQSVLGGGMITHAAAAFIGVLTAVVLLQMAFDRKPVLVIDEDGITCRRPDVGLVPWHAVIGLGTSKATLLRRVMMIAVDEEALDERAQRHVKNRVGFFAAFSPQVARFEGQVSGRPTISVPISYFSTPAREFERMLEEKVNFHGPKN